MFGVFNRDFTQRAQTRHIQLQSHLLKHTHTDGLDADDQTDLSGRHKPYHATVACVSSYLSRYRQRHTHHSLDYTPLKCLLYA